MAFQFEGLSEILVCPKSHAKFVQENDSLVSIDPETRLQYPIRDEIPVLLVDEATKLSADEWAAVMQQHGRDATTGEELPTKEA